MHSQSFAFSIARTIGTAVALIVPCETGFADYFDGNALNQLAKSSSQVEFAMFRGYVAGLQDQYNGTLFCVPENVRLSQASAVVQKYLQDNPQSWHLSGHQIVIQAMRSSFPCSGQR